MTNFKFLPTSTLCCSLFLILLLPSSSNANLLKACNFNVIYQLGDSISDTGNLIRLYPSAPFGRRPYGQDFNHQSTGRCSNGLLMIDYIASSAGLPLLDAYLNLNATHSSGVNFAVAGATALPLNVLARNGVFPPFNDTSDNSLATQLNWMSTYFHSACYGNKCQLNKSLFMVGEIGGNDYNYAFYKGETSDKVKVMSLVPKVVRAIMNAVRKVISYGATRVVVPGNFPIGCLPVYLTIFRTNDSAAYDKFHCLKELNKLATYHNNHLRGAIEEVQQQHQNVAIVYGDYYRAYKWVLKKASGLGFDMKSLQRACCGAGGDYDFSFGRMCGAHDVPVCSNPDKHISWDGIHLTQKPYFYMAQRLIRDMVQKFPHCQT